MLECQEFLNRFLREERFLAAYLLSATGNFHASEDLLQTVARILWEKLADYDEARPFGAWALGVAHLEVLKWRQQAARSRELRVRLAQPTTCGKPLCFRQLGA